MSKVTSKLQLTLPKAIAVQHGIKPGDSLEWASAAGEIRIVPKKAKRSALNPKQRVRIWSDVMRRVDQSAKRNSLKPARPGEKRGWTREDLYTRAIAR